MKFLHCRLSLFHPVVAFAYFVFMIGISFFSMQSVFLLISFSGALLYCLLLQGWRGVRMNLLILLPIIIFTIVINPLFVHQGVTVLFVVFGKPVTLEGVVFGIHAAFMLCGVVLWFSCFNCVITPEKLTYLFGRTVPAISLILSMALRFVPMYRRQFGQVMMAQKGLEPEKQSIFARAKTVMRSLSILTSWALEHSIETSNSMRARGYGLPGRTHFSHYRFNIFDALFLSGVVTLAGVVIIGCFLGENEMLFYPVLVYKPITWFSIVVYIAYAILSFLPAILFVREEIRCKSYNVKT